jgi:hypothetical protein
VWDWSANISNYTTLRVQQESNAKNAGWEIESSIGLNEQLITNVILSGGQYYGNGLASSGPIEATQDYLPVGSPDAGTQAGDGGYESAEQVRDDDVNALFAGLTGPTVRVTRIRSDIAQAAMTADFVLQAAADQSELSNIRTVTQSVNLTCPIYNGCNVVGTGTLAQAQASVDDAGAPLDASLAGQGGSPHGTSPGATYDASVAGQGGSQNAATAPAPNGGGGGGGCAASAQASAGSGVGFGALAGILGLVVGRAVRVRRRRARSQA